MGDNVTADLLRSLDEVLKIRQGRGLMSVFVDATKETSFPSTLPVFEFGSELAKSVRGMRFGAVARDEFRSDVEFLETVVQNRGAQFQTFDSVEAALAWLTEPRGKTDAVG